MLEFEFIRKKKQALKILCLGAHSDDIEIGCSGSILRFLKENNKLEIYWVVFAAKGERGIEATRSANFFLKNALKRNITINNFRDGFFPYMGAEIKECFEKLKKEFSPDIIFTHYKNDLHQDHRTISELTWNTFRDNLILEYEIPKFDGDLGSPNLFIHLDRNICQKKITKIIKSFSSQSAKGWFTEDTFWSILRLRGVESNSPQKYAEAFYCRKIVF